MKRQQYKLEDWMIGLVAGSAVALAGTIKAPPYEGFNLPTFIRPPLVGMAVAWLIARYLKVSNPITLFLATIGGELIIVEGYDLLRARTPHSLVSGQP